MAALSVGERLDALARAVRAGRDVLPAATVAQAARVEERAGHRLRLSDHHTVVALAGSTGSGKSSLLNALTGEPLAEVDVLRPTTSQALAAVRGEEDAPALLDWLGVRRRAVLARPDQGQGDLVLLDLPDHDSVEVAHRLEAERLVALVDLMVWVADPQKYADAVLHERYLRTLSAHADVLLVVLNQVDRLAPGDREAALADLRRLLAADGLAGVRVLGVSAATGEGVDALRAVLDDAAAHRRAAVARVEADVVAVAHAVLEACGARPAQGARTGRGPRGERARRDEALVGALADAAGVPLVARAVEGSTVLAARRTTGWPPTRWLARLRTDPLRALHLPSPAGPAAAPRERTDQPDVVRTSLPPAGPAQRARAAGAVRTWTDAATADLPPAWALAARGAAEDDEDGLADDLDRAVVGTPVLAARAPRWWSVVGAVQWLLLGVLVAGLAWLGVLAGLDALRLPSPEPPRWGEVPVPTLAAAAGLVLGLLVAVVARLAAGVGARRRARRATAQMRASVTDVARRRVVAPVEDVLTRHADCVAAAEQAAGATSGRVR